MDTRYQVFVSSTYEDLRKERQEVIQALLELDCFPAGMELFPAADDDQWTLITKVIDDSDYYLVILAGRYGCTGADGMSYTEREYRYALDQGKPIVAFIHGDLGKIASEHTEKDPGKVKRLEQFRELVKRKMCKAWVTPDQLGGVVSRSIVKLKKSRPAIGWVRGNALATSDATAQILMLQKRVEGLEGELEKARVTPPPGSEDFSQGQETYAISFVVRAGSAFEYYDYKGEVVVTWDEVFGYLAPLMINEASFPALRNNFVQFVERQADAVVASWDPQPETFEGRRLSIRDIDREALHTMLVQFRALGLITHSDRQRSLKDTATYWRLTRYGDTAMVRLRAVRRGDLEAATAGEESVGQTQ